MKSRPGISRRRFLKIVIFSSVALSIPALNSCKNEVIETDLKKSTTPFNLKLKNIQKLTVKQDQNGIFKIPREYVYAPLEGHQSVLVFHRKEGQNELEFRLFKIIKKDEKYFYTKELEDGLTILIDPQKSLNELNKIDHKALEQMFVKKYNVKDMRRVE